MAEGNGLPPGYIDVDEHDKRAKARVRAQKGADAGLNAKYAGKGLETQAVRWPSGEPPERKWVVPGLIPAGNVTMLNGDGGVGKSLLAMQLLTAAATGGKWIGREVKPCRALGVFCEDDAEELQRRQHAINKLYGIEWGDLDDLTLISRVEHDNILIAFEKFTDVPQPSAFCGELQNIVGERGIELIVLDSLHDLFAGNENVRGQARQFIGELRRIPRLTGGALVVTAHPSRAGLASGGDGTSGSTAWNAAVRSRLYLTRPKDIAGQDDQGDDRILTDMKSNYGARGEKIALRWQEGVFIATGEKVSQVDPRAITGATQIALDQLKAGLAVEGEQMPGPPTTPNGTGLSLKKWRERFYMACGNDDTETDTLKKAFQRARERLYSANVSRIAGNWVWLVNNERDSAGDIRA